MVTSPVHDSFPVKSPLVSLISLIQQLIQCPSVTPNPDNTFTIVEAFLKDLGFETHVRVCHEVTNFYAHRKGRKPEVCFAGHVDVVPPGDLDAWSVPPFDGVIKEGFLWGRGVADMKGAIGCFMTAVADFLTQTSPDQQPAISFLLTSDEEGPAVHGTKVMVPWLKETHRVPDFFLIGEPTGVEAPGSCLKVGRRGSVTGTLTCHGVQGHIAYPHLADNPIPRLLRTLNALSDHVFDQGTDTFEPTHLEITSVDVGNPVTNLIPSRAMARFGVRLNTLHTCETVQETLTTLCQGEGGPQHTLALNLHGNAYETQNPQWIEKLSQAVATITGQRPRLDTTGGTTDGRFLSALCPVLELGLPESTIHQVDERVSLEDIATLHALYLSFLKLL